MSFETALAFYQLIPERVHVIAAATSQRSKTHSNAFGTFEYNQIVSEPFYEGVHRVQSNSQKSTNSFLMAPLEKAILDISYQRRINSDPIGFLSNSLRIDLQDIATLNVDTVLKLKSQYKAS